VSQAARRETFEETGLVVSEGALLGRLPEHPSPARYLVTPLVGVLGWPQALVADPAEVADIFTVPLAELLALTPRQEARQLEGQRRLIHFYAHRHGDRERLIWGLTGNILADFLAVVRRFVPA
jgi:8-oxo-dGTP pyrophosphatase MutT (NUDIX family)